ncbi:unnamed protein product [Paramecium pentaurelia]|uniref:Uncharacterized protein n=1 Tax=Paramecium pentaurelia TaxID=43138 RepID=A0A8S1XAG6_9CILI|nr:unnamed protein product [Paramecium pentaurelia]
MEEFKNLRIEQIRCKNPFYNKIDNSICLWDVQTGQKLGKLEGQHECVKSVCFSPDGNTLASGGDDKVICLWEVKTKKKKTKLNGQTNTVQSVCFSPDGNTVASGSDDKSICFWDVITGQEIKSSDKNYKDILAQIKIPLQQHSHISEGPSNFITTLLISQSAIFQAQGALVLEGEFINHHGIDSRPLLKSKSSCISENQLGCHQK